MNGARPNLNHSHLIKNVDYINYILGLYNIGKYLEYWVKKNAMKISRLFIENYIFPTNEYVKINQACPKLQFSNPI